MFKNMLLTTSGVILISSLAGCSTISNAGKSVRNMASFSQQSSTNNVAVNEQLVIPPSLRVPSSNSSVQSTRTNQKRPSATSSSVANKNYYVVVGTYNNQPQAFDTYVRLSSIGLPGAEMESRKAKSGQILHMVRLGPYQQQEKIDKVTNTLTSDGLTQFKIVEN